MDGRTLVVHNGDVSYAEGFVYGWDVFMHMMAPIIQRAPYMLTPGKPLQSAIGKPHDLDSRCPMPSTTVCGLPIVPTLTYVRAGRLQAC